MRPKPVPGRLLATGHPIWFTVGQPGEKPLLVRDGKIKITRRIDRDCHVIALVPQLLTDVISRFRQSPVQLAKDQDVTRPYEREAVSKPQNLLPEPSSSDAWE